MSSVETRPKLAIIGRPNVGKSTLFNRLLGRKRALVHDLPGVTRDRLEEDAIWMVRAKEIRLTLVDTGGLGDGTFSGEIEAQVRMALESANLALLVFDGKAGLTPEDEEVLAKVRSMGALDQLKIIAVVNKVDDDVHEDRIYDFYQTGVGELLSISAEHNRGIEDLKEKIVDEWKSMGILTESGENIDAPEETPPPKVAIVGRPNAGKSTLINAILGEDRMIVSPIAGTTVDSIDSRVTIGGHELILIDTAGIRRKSKTEQGVEVLSVVQTKKALERADIAVLVVDAEIGPSDQEEKIGSLIEEAGLSVIIAVNKWDLIDEKEGKRYTPEMAAEHIRTKMAYLRYAPIVFMSGKRKRGYEDLPELIHDILEKRRRRISTKELTEWVLAQTERHNPFDAKVYVAQQVSVNPPTIVIRVNDPKRVHFSLERHLINRLREDYGFEGSPVRIKIKN